MRLRLTLTLTLAVSVVALLSARNASAQRPVYPDSPIEPVLETIHGVQISDPYRWLENDDDPRLPIWTERQNALTRSYLDRYPRLRAELTAELEKLYDASVMSSPRRFGDRYFYRKRQPGQNQAVLYVRQGGLDAPPRALIDVNPLSDDGTISLDWYHPSPDGRLLAYGKSSGGNEDTTLYLLDVTTGADADLVIPHARWSSVVWDPDGNGFHYTRHPAPGTVPPGDEMYHRYLYYHKLGTDWADDPLVIGKDLPKTISIGYENSCDYGYQLLDTTTDWARNDLFIRKSGQEPFTPVAVGKNARFIGEILGDKLFVRTDYEAPRYRIFVTDVDDPTEANWRDIVPQQTGVIEDFRIVGGKLIVHVLENVRSRLFIHELDGTLVREIELPTLGSVREITGRPEHDDLFFSFASFAYPTAMFHYNLATENLNAIDQIKVDADLRQFVTEQVWFTSKDGTRVPMFVIHKKGLELDGSNPTVLDAYGGFGISIRPGFRENLVPWLKRGGVFAIANIRGGGEFGQAWHLAGRREKKQNVFDDMIAAAEKLIAAGYTRSERLGTTGGSNGGLLMGAMMTQRPDLFRAICCGVPLLDMVRYHHSTIARLWIPEYGSAENADEFAYLHAYSPYHHVKPGTAYPAVLFRTGEFDRRVDPMHARKMTALMQAATAGEQPILLWVERKTGHGTGKPTSKRVAESVDFWTFFMWQLGMLGDAG